MASIALRLDSRSQKNGMSRVRLRISHQHTAAWYKTGVVVEPIYFQESSIHDPIHRKAYMSSEKRELLASIVRQWEVGMFELQRSDGGAEQIARMNATELRDYIFGTKVKKTTATELVCRGRLSELSLCRS